MSSTKEIFIAIIGLGGVGKCFLSQLKNLSAQLSKTPTSPNLSLILISRSNKILYQKNHQSLPLEDVCDSLEKSTQSNLRISEIIEYLAAAPSKVVLVDNTSSQEIANSYPQILGEKISIVTPNKKAFSSSRKLWEDIFTAATPGTHVYHESSVGAGLPIISTLKDLIDTGDEILKIEGVFSGTMSFLFDSFAPVKGSGGSWSAEVKRARELGFTEPDPRDDLNGLDVARKLTILARLVGMQVDSPTSFPVQSLIPKELEDAASADEFLMNLPKFDAQMEEIKVSAEKEGKVVRYVGSITVATNEIRVGVEKFSCSHPISTLKGGDNIISFHTKRYSNSPLIIQGAGAGGDVTAMGVTGDLIKVIRQLS